MTASPDQTGGGPGRPAAVFGMSCLLAALFVIAHFHRSAGAVLAPALTAELALTPAEIGLVVGVMFFVSAALQPFAGVMLDRYGPIRTMTKLSVLAVAGTLLFAWSDGVPGLTLGRAMTGIGFLVMVSGMYVFLISWVRPENFSACAAAIVAIPSIAGGLLASAGLAVWLETVGRGTVFAIVAAATAVLAVAIKLLVREGPRTAARRERESVGDSLRGLWAILRDPRFLRLTAMGCATYGPFMTVAGLWAGPYLHDVHGLAGAPLGYALFATVLAYNLGTLAYGPLDRLFDTRRGVLLAGATVEAALLLALAAIPGPGLWTVVVLLVAASLAAPIFVTLIAHAQALVEPRFAGRAITVTQIGVVGGTFLLQVATGLIVDALAPAGAPMTETAFRIVCVVVAAAIAVCAVLYAGVEDAKPSAQRR